MTGDLEALLDRALRDGDEGDWQAMADRLLGALEDFPDEPAVHCWLGVAERELGMESVAYERFKRCLELDPEDPHILATAGAGIALLDDPEAEQALRTAALLGPDVAWARLMYGAYLAREGLLDEALTELEAAVSLEEDDPQARYELGVAHALKGNADAAVDAVGEAVRLDPEDGWSRVVLGLLLREADREDEAPVELLAGARLRPDDVEAQILAALAAGAAGDEAAAYEMLERARQRGREGDRVLADAAEDQLERGPDAARRFLDEEVAPGALRARLFERP